MSYDVIIVGGSFAGMSAAMQLARARRPILVVDAGAPRNRFAEASHGFLGQDGVAPAAIMREALRQLSAYPSVDFVHGRATAASGELDRFEVTLEDGAAHAARRLVLTTGVTDTLPDIPGLAERWGQSVMHCPYCHGYEVRDRRIGVLANHPMSSHQALMLPDWGPTTFFTQGLVPVEAELAGKLAARGVEVETTPVVDVLGEGLAISGVRLADGRTVALEAIFTAPQTAPTSPLAAQLGCAFEDGMTGPHLKLEPGQQRTSVAGVYSAGDTASPMHNATLASAAGVMAGIGAHQSLIF
ncbi:MAG: NAD(P)/FAD-dependent oxidoreductase [Phenylobacterium sp.]|uniref:NAD(P)/FAD-dependent oxidoreductase n=1 Tax=Phenylobacterium sp. TaxID=1871053 RepID=UPI002727BF06|nr:NAD(P)/FAD-dependent oxidoreductase [Phenylobacterium sp.]MDO8410080.1 NAD(P)/FAD-dependent oxidoreductase [Phenylobacterium sp.]